jgi:hypothetical protein
VLYWAVGLGFSPKGVVGSTSRRSSGGGRAEHRRVRARLPAPRGAKRSRAAGPGRAMERPASRRECKRLNAADTAAPNSAQWTHLINFGMLEYYCHLPGQKKASPR